MRVPSAQGPTVAYLQGTSSICLNLHPSAPATALAAALPSRRRMQTLVHAQAVTLSGACSHLVLQIPVLPETPLQRLHNARWCVTC